MYTSVVRLQNVFGFFTTVAFVVAAFIAASDFVAERAPIVRTLKTTSVQVVRGRPHYYSSKKEEYAVINFSLDADLSSLFTWNTKQVFVYVTAEWPAADHSTTNATNEAVIWDSIITSPSADHLANHWSRRHEEAAQERGREDGKLVLKNQRHKYKITHPSGKLATTENVTLRLHYNVQPWVGLLTWNQDVDYGYWKALKNGVSKRFKLPAIKEKKPASAGSR
ncbi:unnamed protein product [Sordaria macrospora k-hell]|uniref:Signal peptidase subunit 3 n=1 Tax=Sordaria macrospora (strain ATCC MYA-333 / DSM 997 / K(L3346) / K-hell) TaxID=771870 RepID=F7W4L5_SORMK|nr:uncharacterized protein SMAC_06533 [Sordaria macrospora k-hell]CCC12452.1 unnamed protein product [Sordaria macrospora k-hell]